MGVFRKFTSTSNPDKVDAGSAAERDDDLLAEQLQAPAPPVPPGHRHEFTDIRDIDCPGEPAYLLRCDCGYLTTLPRAS